MYDMKEGSSRTVRVRDVCCIATLGVVIFAAGIVGGLLIGIYAYHGGPDTEKSSVNVECVASGSRQGQDQTTATGATPTSTPGYTTENNTTCPTKTCPQRQAVQDSRGQEIFAPLTENEMINIREVLIQKQYISGGSDLNPKSNYINNMEMFPPKKDDVLNFLDNNGPYPGRYARVTVTRGALTPPDLMVFLVGPLEDSDIQVKQEYADGEIPFDIRFIDTVEFINVWGIFIAAGDIINPILVDSCDGAHLNGGGLQWWPFNGPPGLSEHDREIKVNVMFYPYEYAGAVHTMDMLPISAVINSTGNDASKWSMHSFYYLNQGPFATANDLVTAYNNGTILRKFKLPNGYSKTILDRSYVGRDKSQPLREFATTPPPRTYEPLGPRYTITGHHVQWMGWSFDASGKMMRGGAIYDIRYKNTRIAYELALNEISLIYGSDSFEHSTNFLTDSTAGLGLYENAMRDVDCPVQASLLETSYYDSFSGSVLNRKSICVFESDGETAEWRHIHSGYKAGLRRTFLVVRYSVTVGNYDYIIDYEFHLDGKIMVKAKATGFIFTSFWDPDNPNRDVNSDGYDGRDAFGFRVSDYSHGLIHDHMFGFKVDLDIISTNNSFEVIHFKAGDLVDALKSQNPSITSKPNYFDVNVTRYLEYETIQTERGFRADPENPAFWTIVNENYRNKWGVKRGYHIAPLSSALQTMVDSHPAMQAISFSKYTCAATKYKDSEPFLTSVFDSYRVDNAKEDLDKKLNGENIVNEDIVNWVSVGFLHIPTSEDVPMTSVVESGFMLKPFNFFDKTDVYDMPGFYKPNEGTTEYPPEVDPCLENNPNI